MIEDKCQNPLNPKCGNADIAVTIQVGFHMLPICRRCWREIAERRVEWGEWGLTIDGRRVNLQKIFGSKRARAPPTRRKKKRG